MHRTLAGLVRWSLVVVLAAASVGVYAQSVAAAARQPRCIGVEVYVRGEAAGDKAALDEVRRFVASRPGLKLRVYDLDRNATHRSHLAKLCKYFRIDVQTPLAYSCGQIARYSGNLATFRSELAALNRLTMYVRGGCPRCGRAKAWVFDSITRAYPGFEVKLRDIVSDAQASRDLQALVRKHGTTAASVPVFHVCDEVLVGFDTRATTGPRLEAILRRWTVECPPTPKSRKAAYHRSRAPRDVHSIASERQDVPTYLVSPLGLGWNVRQQSALVAGSFLTLEEDSVDEAEGGDHVEAAANVEDAIDGEETPDAEDAEADEEIDDAAHLPLPGESTLPLPGAAQDDRVETSDSIPADAIDLPVFGRVEVNAIGLPLFTIAVGLVDGFNPCAMWVLLFLLSVLVNVHSRWKMLAVAGTFVVISGAVYFAFMAAWLNVFLWVGMLQPVRIALASLGIAMGLIHIKDFFAFKRGITLSIPESAKPGIYQRVRRIVTAENVTGAIAGAAVLAALVNVVELLCTAGLPALYTQILSAQQLPTWQNYLYLLLYNLAYMLDDALMVTIAVITLGRRKLQETHGRWLKLISGITILVLGLMMLLRPDWLGMN